MNSQFLIFLILIGTLKIPVDWRLTEGRGLRKAAYWRRLAANLFLKLPNVGELMVLSSSWFQSVVVRMKKLFLNSIVWQRGTINVLQSCEVSSVRTVKKTTTGF